MRILPLLTLILIMSILFLSSEVIIKTYFESAFNIFDDFPLIPIIISMLTFTTLIGTIRVKQSE